MAQHAPSKRIERLNLALIALSALSAILFPFETLLLAYAVLGPLHYLTEMSWLHDRRYFLPRRGDVVPLLLVGAAVVGLATLTWFTRPDPGVPLREIERAALFAMLGFAVILVTLHHWRTRLIATALLLPLCWLLGAVVSFGPSLAAYLPTVIHVYVFTGLFLALGWLRQPNRTSASALLAYTVLPITCWVLPVRLSAAPSAWASEAYLDTLSGTSRLILGDGGLLVQGDALLHQPAAILVARLLAFAYLYHYLNWFAKVGVIGWARISQRRALCIATGWLFAVLVYFHDYKVGFLLLLTLSFLHVLLEFPLNGLTLRQLGRQLQLRSNARMPADELR